MFYLILIILYFVAFGFLAWKNLKWGIYILVFGLPSYLIRFNVGPLPMTALEGMILILFGIWAIKLFKHLNRETLEQESIKKLKQEIESNLFLYACMFIFLLSATMAVMVAPETRAAMGLWKAYFIEPILFFIVFISVIKKEDLKNIFWVLAESSLVVSAVAVYQKITGNLIANEFWAAEAARRVSGVFSYPNALALYAAPIMILLIGFFVGWFREWKISQQSKINNQKLGYGILNIKYYLKRLLLVLAIVFGLGAIYWSGSKGAIIGMAAGIFFYALFWSGKRKYFWPVAVAGIFLAGWLWQSGRINLKGNYSVEGGDSISVRQEMWEESREMILDRPIFGAGLGGYQEVVEEYHKEKHIEIYLYPHNIFLNFWSELGVLGLVGFLGIIWWFYGSGFKILKPPGRGLKAGDLSYDQVVVLLAGMTTLLVHGLVDVPYFKNDLSVLFWVFLGMMCVVPDRRILKSSQNEV